VVLGVECIGRLGDGTDSPTNVPRMVSGSHSWQSIVSESPRLWHYHERRGLLLGLGQSNAPRRSRANSFGPVPFQFVGHA